MYKLQKVLDKYFESNKDLMDAIKASNINNLLKNNKAKSLFEYRGVPAYFLQDGRRLCVVLKKGNLLFSSLSLHMDEYSFDSLLRTTRREYLASAILIPRGDHNQMVLNGDIHDGEIFEGVFHSHFCYKYPTLSFLCFSRFFSKTQDYATVAKTFKQVAEWFNQNLFELVDFTLDENRELTAEEKMAANKSKLTPPESGFTCTGTYWHRPATLLIRDKETNIYYLFGQDEAQYFGVELPQKCKTVKEAFIALIPKKIRNIKGVQRQGEWFIVPVDKSKIPKIEECIGSFYDTFNLPVDSPDSARHYILGEGRIAKDGTIYAQGNLGHSFEQHSPVNWKGWATFVKNTAIRSVSQDGVD